MSTRDPRKDPMPGDVLKKGEEQKEYLGDGRVRSYDLTEEHTPRGHQRNISLESITAWRKWAKDAEVIYCVY